jgi:hypothetical protein
VTRPSRWLIAAGVSLALALTAGAATLVWQRFRPRLPALSTATTVALDQALAATIAAAGDAAAVTVTGLVPATGCENTRFAKGHRYTRTAQLFTDPGAEKQLIDQITATLQTDGHAQPTAPNTTTRVIDFGSGVQLQILKIDQGWVAATAETDCAVVASGSADPSAPPSDSTIAINQLFRALGVTAATWNRVTLPCAVGATTTVTGLSTPTKSDAIADRLAHAVPAHARTFASDSNRLAWRDGNISVIASASDDGTHIAIQRTTSC